MVIVRVPPSDTEVPLIVILLLYNAEFGILYKFAPLPLKIPVVMISPLAVMVDGEIADPEIDWANWAELVSNPAGLLRILIQSRASFVSFSLGILPSINLDDEN